MADIGAGYYEPSGVDYGGWGPGYHVAPFRGGDHRPTGGGGHAICASLQIRACFPLDAVYSVAVAFWWLAITLKCGPTKILSVYPGGSELPKSLYFGCATPKGCNIPSDQPSNTMA